MVFRRRCIISHPHQQCLHVLTSTGYFLWFYSAPRVHMKNYLTEVLTCVSLMTNDDEHLVEKWFLSFSVHFLSLLLSYSSYIFGYYTLIRYMIFKFFSPFCKLSLHILNNALWYIHVFNCDEIQFIYFLFCCLSFWCPV